jgi:hypothetical protein
MKVTKIFIVLIAASLFFKSTSCNFASDVVVVKTKSMSTIDSIWFTTPGQENTMQTDFRYYGKLKNGQVIVSNSKPFNIGDSITCIYYRYETTKTKKKQ